MSNLIAELKRRNVFRVVAAYVVLSWLMLQIGDILFDALELPDWSVKLLIALLALGFVPAFVFSWAYELTPDGLKKESDLDPGRPENITSGKKLDFITIGMIVLGIAVVWIDRFVLERSEPGPVPQTTVGAPDSDQQTTSVTESAVPADERSIAVLPFLNLSSDQEQEYFSDGLADTILHKLAQLPDLRVAARTSSFKFKGHSEDMRDIASQLGVATVLEGSVQRQGNRVRITVQLIQGADGSHLWSQVFDDTLDDIFRVQDDIARGVVEAMASTWQEDGQPTGDMGGTANVAAYEAYLKGIEARQKGTPAGASEALAQLQLAVDLDPDYARAWVSLSYALEGPARLGTATWESTYEPMRRAAERAIELAPGMAAAHLALANALRGQNLDSDRADQAVERALELAPNDASVLAAMGRLRNSQGKVREALKLTEKAVLINPLDTGLQIRLAFRRVAVGLIEPAISAMAKLVEQYPEDVELRMDWADLLRSAGKDLEAARVYRQVLNSNPDLLRALFRNLFMHVEWGSIEEASNLLLRVESLSPNRALDDHAEFCLVTGDQECFEAYSKRYLDLLRDSELPARADLLEADTLIQRGEFERAFELLKGHAYTTDGVGSFADIRSGGLNLALVFDRLGDLEARDQLLDMLEEKVQESLANGLWTRLAGLELVPLAAARGDAKLAANRLSIAIDQGWAPSYGELQHYAVYDTVRDAPEFQAQMERLKTRNEQLRERLITEGVW